MFRRDVPPPFLHGYVPPPSWTGPTGWVIEDNGWYWTGRPVPMSDPAAWSRNPRRALVESVAPWGFGHGGFWITRGRCVEVLLDDSEQMLPLYKWPPSAQLQT